jgi:hypothetical protein
MTFTYSRSNLGKDIEYVLLYLRVWTLQERILSRYLIYGIPGAGMNIN